MTAVLEHAARCWPHGFVESVRRDVEALKLQEARRVRALFWRYRGGLPYACTLAIGPPPITAPLWAYTRGTPL